MVINPIMADGEKKNVFEGIDETVLSTEREIEGEEEGHTPVGPYLVIIQGPKQGFRFPLRQGENFIGRAIGSEVMLEDQSVSRRHAKITWTPDGWLVEDAGSKNGTFVNGKRISEKVTVGHGDIIQAGIYTLRIITRPVPEEEVKSLPPDWEGKTVMMGVQQEEETATIAEEARAVQEPKAAAEEPAAVSEPEAEIPIPQEILEERRRPLWLRVLLISLIVMVVAGALAYVYFEIMTKPPQVATDVKRGSDMPPQTGEEAKKPVEPGLPAGSQPVAGGEMTGAAAGGAGAEKLPASIPVFLDFASNPLPAKVFFQGEELGSTPLKTQVRLDAGKTYSAEAEFDLQEIDEKYREAQTFVVGHEEPLIKILFKGPIGVLKVIELPRGVDLYLEGYFIYDPFKARTAKLDNVVFGKPVYIPFGKYIIELRGEKELAGSGEYIKDIKYRREVLLTEDQPVLELKVTEGDLGEFPIEIISIPTGADVFIDAAKVGKTPHQGVFPVGEHTLVLRKDGYFEHKQEIRMDKNIPVKLEVPLKTTVAGEFINAGKLLMQNGRFKEAIDKLTGVFNSNPTPGETAQARYLIGSCFVHMGDLATAEGYFRQSVEDAEMKHPSLLGLVSVFHAQGRIEEAIPYLVEVFLNSRDEEVLKEARALFQQISPLKSIVYITSTPAGARVYLNDQLRSEVTPLIIPGVPLGSHKIRIEKDGFLPQELRKNFSINEFEKIIVELQPVQQ